MTADLIWDAHTGVGECPTWDAHNHRLLFCDIPAGRIHAYSPTTGARKTWQLPEVVGSFGLCRSGRLIVALRHRVVFYDLVTETLTDFTQPVDEPATNRLNDGKVGPDGSFWVGSMDENPDRKPTGKLYRVTPDGKIAQQSDGYVISNGLAWSPDGTRMYHACSRQGFIDAWDYRHGEIGNRRLFATQTPGDGMPDGAAVDEGGRYWSAGVTAGCLNVFDHEGQLEDKIELPVATPTMPCFTPHGIFVTSLIRAGQEADHPLMGGLFRLPSLLRGTQIAVFEDTAI